MAAREKALAAYRAVLRSIPIAFKDDSRLLIGAKQQARQAFEGNRSLAGDNEEMTKAIEHARDVAKFLRQNVVQATTQGDDRYKLHIHEETERGDNDTIKMAGQKLKQKPI